MLKKLSSLLLSLLLCFTLLPGQAFATENPPPPLPPVSMEPLNPEETDVPPEISPLMPLNSEQMPGDEDDYHIS